jgi:hypothetical protein
MKLLSRVLIGLLFLGTTSTLLALQRSTFQNYRSEYGSVSVDEKYEFSFTRLPYPTPTHGFGGLGGFRGGWSEDYPRADRQFMEGVDSPNPA